MLLKQIISFKLEVLKSSKYAKTEKYKSCCTLLCVCCFLFMHKMGRKLKKKYHKAMSLKIYFT